MGMGVSQTPNIGIRNVDPAAIQRAAAGLPSSVYNTLAQVAGTTPGSQLQGSNYNTGGFSGGYNYQVSLETWQIGAIKDFPVGRHSKICCQILSVFLQNCNRLEFGRKTSFC